MHFNRKRCDRGRTNLVCLFTLLVFTPLTVSAVTPSPGCGSDPWASGTHTMDFDGQSRVYRVHVPAGYDGTTPAPLVLVFHGWGADENQFLGHRAVRDGADARGYIVVAPRGLGSGAPDNLPNSWTFSGSATGVDGEGGKICDDSITEDYSYPSCSAVRQNSCNWTHCQQNDVEFVMALVGRVEENLCVDRDRIYATGGSNGGMFTWELGQNPESAPTFRAIAPLIGLPHRGYLAAPGRPGGMPVLVITGTRDPVVPPGQWDDSEYTTTSNDTDRYYYTGASAITRSWASAIGCDTSRDAVPFDAGVHRADCRTFCSADPGWPRELDCRAPMGHVYELGWSWRLILEFFDRL